MHDLFQPSQEKTRTSLTTTTMTTSQDDETSSLLVRDEYGNRKETSVRFPTIRTLLLEGSPVLVNEGSTARDHLANERTYLAWTRTGLALIGASLGLLKWDAASSTVGYLVAIMGIVVLVTATQRYFRNMQLLEVGKFEPNVHGVLSVVVVVVVAIVVAFALQFEHEAQANKGN